MKQPGNGNGNGHSLPPHPDVSPVDGLVDLDELAKPMRFVQSVRCTRAVWARCGNGHGGGLRKGSCVRLCLLEALWRLRTQVLHRQAVGLQTECVGFGLRIHAPEGKVPLHCKAVLSPDGKAITIHLDEELKVQPPRPS